MKHRATDRFWRLYHSLPDDVQRVADKNFELLKQNPRHPSLRLKRIGELWSARVGLEYRALALESKDGLDWIWIGPHDEYDKLTS